MTKAYITDKMNNPDIERKYLGNNLAETLSDDMEVLIVWHEIIDRQYIDKLPKLKGIVRYGVGYDNIAINYAKEKGIYVCNTPDYGTEEVSDSTIAMIINIARGISRFDIICRINDNSWHECALSNLKRNSHQTVGVIGAGRIGGSVLLKANALRFHTICYDPYKERGYEKLLDVERVDELNELLAKSDIISIHTPLTDETQSMVTTEFISKMKSGASLVNTARGGVISDIDIFYEPMKSEHISNLALDVLPHEPPVTSKLINAWRNREEWIDGRLIINPHSAYYSNQAYEEMRRKAALNALRIIEGNIPYNIVNPV